MAENESKAALEAEINKLAVKMNEISGDGSKCSPFKELEMDQRLDAIYDKEPLGFERDPIDSGAKMLAQDPLEEVNLGDEKTKRVTYISAKLSPGLKQEVIEVLKENKDCFAWDYDEMPGLKRELVEHRLQSKMARSPSNKLLEDSHQRFSQRSKLRSKGCCVANSSEPQGTSNG